MILWTSAALAIGSLWSLLPDELATVRSGLVFVALLAPIAAILLTRSSAVRWQPQMDLADALVAVGSLALLGLLLIPYVGGAPDDVLLDLARGYDNYSHFTMLRNLVVEGSSVWQTADGARPFGPGYPVGVHYLMAFAIAPASAIESGIPSGLLRDYGALSAMAVTMAAALLGWVATEVASMVPDAKAARGKRLLASVAFVIAAPAGGLFSGLFEVGHVPFALPAATIVAAAWLAVSLQGQSLGPALGLLIVASVGALGSYPPLLAGLVPTAATVLLRTNRRIPRTAVAVAVVAGAVATVLVFWGLRDSLSIVFTAQGQLSTHPLIAITGVALLAVLLLVARTRATSPQALLSAGPVLGFGVAAVGIALIAGATGAPILGNYYLGKMLQAQWIAALPVLIGFASGLLADWHSRRRRHREPTPWLLTATGALLGLLLAYVPDGRYLVGPDSPAPGGFQLLERRLLEGSRARGAANVVATAEGLGPALDGPAVLIDPAGWGGYVTHDDPEWTKAPSVASEWLASLRGVTSSRDLAYARCSDLPVQGALDCLRELQQEKPGQVVTLVVPADKVRGWNDLLSATEAGIRVVAQP